jgi:hypothetical protein
LASSAPDPSAVKSRPYADEKLCHGGAGRLPGMKPALWLVFIREQPPLVLQLPQPAVKFDGMSSHCAPSQAHIMLLDAADRISLSPE